jgi:hypothetical protein
MEPLDDQITQPVDVQVAVQAVNRARHFELLLVGVVCFGALGLTGATAYNTYRIKQITNTNKKAQDFGLRAVECILDNFADHRWSNQVFHDNLANFFHAPTTPHVPLPLVPTDAQFANDCAPFNLRTEQREGTGGPTITGPDNTVYPSTTTTGAKK